jgi:RNA-binding protein
MSATVEAGEVVHFAKSGRLILKISKNIKLAPGEILADESGKTIGKVTELIGPVEAPYASIILFDIHTGRVAGSTLFRLSSQGSRLARYKKNARPLKRKKTYSQGDLVKKS